MIPKIFKDKMRELSKLTDIEDIHTKENILVLASEDADSAADFQWLYKNFERLAHQMMDCGNDYYTQAKPDPKLLKVACFYAKKADNASSSTWKSINKYSNINTSSKTLDSDAISFIDEVKNRIKEAIEFQKHKKVLAERNQDKVSFFSKLPKELLIKTAMYCHNSDLITPNDAAELMQQELAILKPRINIQKLINIAEII